MRNLILLFAVLAMVAGCSMTGGKVKETYKSTFPSVPLEERVGGAWTGGPDGSI
jgi:uncharacterized protein YceK